MPLRRLAAAALLLGAAAGLSGCASHVANLAEVRADLVAGYPDSAMAAFDKGKAKRGDLLWQLDRAFLLHADGQWKASNDLFEAAELHAEELVTKSLSREALALMTNDLVRPYSGLPFELKMIPYYRALNYLELGDIDGALVEARKSSDRLARNTWADSASARSHQEAFLHFVNGMLFTAGGETENAGVSFRIADQLYRGSSPVAGFDPPSLEADIHQNVVVFLEAGFVPYREAVDLTLPIFKKNDWGTPDWYWHTYGDDLYSYRPGHAHGDIELDHVLRVAFPRLVEPRTRVARCEVIDGDGRPVTAVPALNLDAVCRDDFNGRLSGMFIKTIARLIAKESARKEAAKKNEAAGYLLNLIGAATEQADTRSWSFLPSRIDFVRLPVRTGRTTLGVRFYDAADRIVEEQSVTFEVHPGRTEFLHFRTYR
jgi:hypothetical protein